MAIEGLSVVLVHGAWSDGSIWARVISALKAEGTRVLAAPLPLTSLADDVAALNRSLDRTTEATLGGCNRRVIALKR
jgi:pimeloyl-ACP methyl ester carboxylesterase